MKLSMGILTAILLSLSVSVNAYSPGKPYGKPIVFEIVSENSVEVNGRKASIKKSWMKATDYIDPEKINVYRIKNASKYSAQADEIERNMAIVAETTGVEIERE